MIKRYINADAYASTGDDFLGFNMFAYCGNCPATRKDASGKRHCAATSTSEETQEERSVACQYQREVKLAESRNTTTSNSATAPSSPQGNATSNTPSAPAASGQPNIAPPTVIDNTYSTDYYFVSEDNAMDYIEDLFPSAFGPVGSLVTLTLSEVIETGVKRMGMNIPSPVKKVFFAWEVSVGINDVKNWLTTLYYQNIIEDAPGYLHVVIFDNGDISCVVYQ